MKNPNTNLNALQADVFKSVQVLAKRAENEAPRRARTWERILRVSTRLFVDRGYPDVSIEDIAKATEVTRATLYNYVSNKEELLIAALAEERLVNLELSMRILDERRTADKRVADAMGLALRVSELAPLATDILRRGGATLADLRRNPVWARVLEENSVDRDAFLLKLLEDAFPGAFSKEELSAVGAMLRSLSAFGAALGDPSIRRDQPLDLLVEELAHTLMEGLRRRAERGAGRAR